MTRSFLAAAALAAAIAVPAAAQSAPAPAAGGTVWRIDTNHSELSFRVRHFVSRVRGTFGTWEGIVTAEPGAWADGTVEVTVQTASVDTQHERRDTHLRSADFFDVENHPTMTFTSNRVVVNGRAINVEGDLTIRGTTRPVVLTGEYLGEGPDPGGGERIAFVASTTIDRQDFGVSFNQLVEGVGMIGDEVEISLAIEAVRQ